MLFIAEVQGIADGVHVAEDGEVENAGVTLPLNGKGSADGAIRSLKGILPIRLAEDFVSSKTQQDIFSLLLKTF